MKTGMIIAAALCFPLLTLDSCQKRSPGWKGTIEERDGIVVVHNPLNPLHEGDVVKFEEELSIGRDDGDPEYVFSTVAGLDVDDMGRIYLIDGADANVRVFDENGKFVRAMGRKGQGPGEMQRPVFIQLTPQAEIMVVDYFAARALFFSRDGIFLYQKTTFRPILPLGRDSRGNLVGMDIPAPPPLGGKIINKYDFEFKLLMEIAKEEMGTSGTFDIGKPSCYCAVAPSDNLIWGNSAEYALYVLDPQGKVLRKITKDYEPQPITETDKDNYKNRYSEPLKAGMKINFRHHYPAFSDILVDDKGRFFVKTYEPVAGKAGSNNFDVYDQQGIFLAKVPVTINLARNSVWKKGKLYTIENEAKGFPAVKRFKVTWED